jgi:hypothetical protein
MYLVILRKAVLPINLHPTLPAIPTVQVATVLDQIAAVAEVLR